MRHIFGPVPSRRLGFSLGLDPVLLKTCTYNCIYCQLGRTNRMTLERETYIPADWILGELRRVLAEDRRIDYITFSGSGEPTLHAKLGEMIRKIKRMTPIPVAVLTNGSLLSRKEVRRELAEADLVIPSLDAVSEEVFRKINRPHGRLDLGEIIEGLKALRGEYSGQVWLEIMFVRGINDTPEEIERMRSVISEIGPDRIQLNTVVRPPAEHFAHPVSPENLEHIQSLFGDRCEVIAKFERKEQSAYKEDVERAIMTLVERRPVIMGDLSDSLGLHRNEAIKYIEVLAASPIPGQQARTVRQGIAIIEDDATLRKAVEIAHRHDIAVWLLISGVRGDHTSAHHDDRGSPGGDDLKAALQALRIRPLRHAALPRGTQDGPKGL